MIKPTIGRQVLYRPKDTMDELSVRHTATIAFCHSDTMVNLGCLDENGQPYSEQLVRLVHGTEACLPGCCEFPPYAKSKAGIEPMERPVPQELSDEALDERIKKVSSVWNELGRNLSDEALNQRIDGFVNVSEYAGKKENLEEFGSCDFHVKPSLPSNSREIVEAMDTMIDNDEINLINTTAAAINSKEAPVKKAAKPKPAAKG